MSLKTLTSSLGNLALNNKLGDMIFVTFLMILVIPNRLESYFLTVFCRTRSVCFQSGRRSSGRFVRLNQKTRPMASKSYLSGNICAVPISVSSLYPSLEHFGLAMVPNLSHNHTRNHANNHGKGSRKQVQSRVYQMVMLPLCMSMDVHTGMHMVLLDDPRRIKS